MTRIEERKLKKEAKRNKIIKYCTVYGTLFVVVSVAAFGYFVNKENDKIKKFILNYDKTKTVYSLQKDFKGGNL